MQSDPSTDTADVTAVFTRIAGTFQVRIIRNRIIAMIGPPGTIAQDAPGSGGNNPGHYQHEQRSDTVQLVDSIGLPLPQGLITAC